MRDTRALLAAVLCAVALVCTNFSSRRNCCSALVLRTLTPRRGINNNSSSKRSSSSSKPYHARGGVSGLRATWIDEQVSLELPASREEAYFLYSNLRRQPEWSPWLKSVEYDQATGTSKWVIQANGVKVSWRARNTIEIPGFEVAWESTTGLKNRGKVAFVDSGSKRCLMTLTLSYNLPYVIASVLRLEAVERFVKRTLLSDLGRFKTVLARETVAVTAAAAAAATADSPAAATPGAVVDGAVAVAVDVAASAATTPSTAASAAATPSAVSAAVTSATAADTPPAAAATVAVDKADAEREAGDNTVNDFAGEKGLDIDRATKPASTTYADSGTATDTVALGVVAAAAEASVGAAAVAATVVGVRNEMVGEGRVDKTKSSSGGDSSDSEGDSSSGGVANGGGSDSSSSSDVQVSGVVHDETTAMSTSTPPLGKSGRHSGDESLPASNDPIPDATAAAGAAAAAAAAAASSAGAGAYASANVAAATNSADDTVAAGTSSATTNATTSPDDSANADAAATSPAAQSPADTSTTVAAEGKSEEQPAGSQRLGRRGRMKKRLRRLFRRSDGALPPAESAEEAGEEAEAVG